MISSQNASGTEKICLRKTKTTWRFCFLFFPSFQMQAASDLIQLWSILLSQSAAEQLLKGGQKTEEKRANLRQATIDGGPEKQTINEASPFRSAFRENTKSSLLINVSPPVSVSCESGKCGLTFPPFFFFFLTSDNPSSVHKGPRQVTKLSAEILRSSRRDTLHGNAFSNPLSRVGADF